VHAQPLHNRHQFLALWTAGLNRLAADRLRVCRKLALVVSGLTKIYGTCIKFVRVNIHDPKTAALQTQLGFMTTPEFFLLDPGGRVVHQWAEDITGDSVAQVLDALQK